MNDAVTKILDLADALAQEAKDYGHLDHSPARQALQDELVRLFTPLTHAQIHNADPMPHVMFDTQRVEFARAIEVLHGITGEKNEPDPYWHLRNIPGLLIDKDGNIGVGPK